MEQTQVGGSSEDLGQPGETPAGERTEGKMEITRQPSHFLEFSSLWRKWEKAVFIPLSSVILYDPEFKQAVYIQG